MPHDTAADALPAPPRLQLLGTPALWVAGAEPQALNREDAALLALLAVDGATSRARALALLWPDRTETGARNTLRQHLFRLRRATGAELIHTHQDLLLPAPGLAHDLDALPGLRAALARDATARAGDLLGSLTFDDLPAFEAWLDAARSRWRARRADAVAAAAQTLEDEGRLAEAIAHATRLVTDEPWLEHARRRLIRLHYRRGDHGAALAAFEDYRAALHAQLGERPSGETLALVDLVRAGDAATAAPPATRRPAPTALLRPPRLVGRDAALAALESAWQRRVPALVAGEPGIGKTRLLTEFVAARGPCATIRVRPGDAAVPWLLLGRVLRTACAAPRAVIANDPATDTAWADAELARLVPEWGAAPAEPLDPLRLQRAAELALASAPSASILIDDLQWADAASLAMLPSLWGTTGPRWLLAVRAAERPEGVMAWQAALGDDELCQLALHPLEPADTAALIGSLALPGVEAPHWAARLHQHSGGNPLFLLETLLALSRQPGDAATLPLPETVSTTIQRRLALLTPTAMQLAQVAAVAGQDFALDVAASVLALSTPALLAPWHELEAAQVIHGEAFVHDLVRDATLQTVPAVIARQLHRDIAAALAPRAAPHRTAWHWREAAAWFEAGEAFMRAARVAYDASRVAEAAGHFESAADCCARGGDRAAQQRALQELIGCHTKHHDLASARHFAVRLRSLATDAAQTAWALDRLGDIANMARDDRAAETAAREMLALGPHADDETAGWVTFNATRKLAVALAHLGRGDEALALFDTQTAWAESHPAEWNVHVWLADRGYVLDVSDRRGAACAADDIAARTAQAHENWYSVYAATRNRALAHHWAGRLAPALADIDTAVRLADRIGDATVRSNPREASRRAVLLRDAGRHGESLLLLEHSVATLASGHSPFWLAYCQDQLALGYLAVGQHARAGALLRDEPGSRAPEAQATRWLARARCARQGGERASPAALPAVLDDPGCPPRWRLLAQLEHARGLPPDVAGALAGSVATQAGARELHGIALHARVIEASAAAQAGAGRAATPMVVTTFAALADGACHPTGLPLIEGLWLMHQALETLGEHAAAGNALQHAAERLRERELGQVPEPFRDSFMHRHPVHQRVLAGAARARPPALTAQSPDVQAFITTSQEDPP